MDWAHERITSHPFALRKDGAPELGGLGVGDVHQMKFFAGLEADGFAGGDADLGAGARVAPDAGLARLDGEDAESAKLDAVSRDECLLHTVKDGVHCVLCLRSRKPGPLNDPLDKILFDHFGSPLSRNSCGLRYLSTRSVEVMLGIRPLIVNAAMLP